VPAGLNVKVMQMLSEPPRAPSPQA
jgi:hypothetical protein